MYVNAPSRTGMSGLFDWISQAASTVTRVATQVQSGVTAARSPVPPSSLPGPYIGPYAPGFTPASGPTPPNQKMPDWVIPALVGGLVLLAVSGQRGRRAA